jgi:two-component system chemotaxis sensor kinase CheA
LQLSIDENPKETRRSIKVEELALRRLYSAASECRIDQEILGMIQGLTERPICHTLGWLENTWQKTLSVEDKEGNPINWGGDVRVSREPYRQLFQSFVHIIRNTVDHGIEMPHERLQSGKSERGNLWITVERKEDNYFITFKDDGRGIDSRAVLEVAARKGIQIPEGISRDEILMLLAARGLSSKDTVTELSGRGIGLDVVRYEARQLGGDLTIRSELGQGTEIIVWFKHRSGLS